VSFFSLISSVLRQQGSLPNLIVKYLVIAGGGGGGAGNDGGGGGAGGYRTSYESVFYTGTLSQLGSDIDGEAEYDWFGFTVDISSDGGRLAVGATLNDGSGVDAGNVRVFDWNGSAWVQAGSDIDGEAAGDQFGRYLSLSSDGDRLAVGAIFNDGSGVDAGSVRVFDWNGSAWVQAGSDIDGEAADDRFGRYLDLSSDGNRLAVGADRNDGSGVDAGSVRVFDWNGSSWVQVGSDIDGEAAGDWFGYALALSSDGNRLAVGAYLNDGNGTDSGHVRVFDWNGSAWVQAGSDIDSEVAGDLFGVSVALSSDGNRLAVGAASNDGNGTDSGHVRVFDWNGSAWVQAGSDIDGEDVGDQFGVSVALSSDGNRLAVGASLNDGGGFDSGHVRVFDWNGSSWVQVGSDIDGEAEYDRFGRSVALSSNGDRLAIGGFLNDGGGVDNGHVRVYEFAPVIVGVSGGGSSVEEAVTLNPGELYNVTVGAGGAANVNGSLSEFIIIGSQGGGHGGGNTVGVPTVGGSGGGGGAGTGNTTGAAGTVNQGYAGGNYVTDAGGGGGAGGPGQNGNTTGAQAYGGVGLASRITGSIVRRGGGGGGGNDTAGYGVAVDGGGSGTTSDGLDGDANTGGGGGGTNGQTPGAGGSGVVILRYPDSYVPILYSGLTGTTVNIENDNVTTITAGTGNITFLPVSSSSPMVLVFDTSLGDTTIEMPLEGTVSCTIDWGDGTYDSYTTVGTKTHTYDSDGEYTVKVFGLLTGFGANVTRPELTKCLSFGEIGLTSLVTAFRGCANLTQVPTSLPTTSAVTTIQGMFRDATSFNQDISGWDTSSITGMYAAFHTATSFNQDISSWDTSSVENMVLMFNNATSFDQNLGSWDVTSLLFANDMFAGVTLSAANYEALLIGWAAQSVQPNVLFGGGNSQYSFGEATTARSILTSAANGWTITDGGPEPVSGMILWLDASNASTITASSGKVSQWDDLSGSGNSVTQPTSAYQPTTGTRTLNGLNVIDFDGASDEMQKTSANIMGGEMTAFVVFQHDGGGGGATPGLAALVSTTTDANNFRTIYGDTRSGTNRHTIHRASGTYYLLDTTGPISTTVPYIYSTTVSSAGNAEAFVNGVSVGTQTFPELTTTATFFVGNRLQTVPADAIIAEIVLFDISLTSNEMNEIITYLSTKWGV